MIADLFANLVSWPNVHDILYI